MHGIGRQEGEGKHGGGQASGVERVRRRGEDELRVRSPRGEDPAQKADQFELAFLAKAPRLQFMRRGVLGVDPARWLSPGGRA